MSFNFNRKTEYALVALARLAEAADHRHPVSAREIAEGYELPCPVVTVVMKQLQRAGLIDSVRGAAGGYYLARPAADVTLGEVVAVMEGPVHLTLCCEGDPHEHEHEADQPCPACRVMQNCAITDSMRTFNDMIVEMLDRITLDDLVAGSLRVGLKRNGRAPARSERARATA